MHPSQFGFVLLFWAAWTACLISILLELLTGTNLVSGNSLELGLWLIFCGFPAWFLVTAVCLWYACGYENIQVTERSFVISRRLFLLHITDSYPLRTIQTLSPTGPFGAPWTREGAGWTARDFKYLGFEGDSITMRHLGAKHCFGIHLEEDDAREIVTRLQSLEVKSTNRPRARPMPGRLWHRRTAKARKA